MEDKFGILKRMRLMKPRNPAAVNGYTTAQLGRKTLVWLKTYLYPWEVQASDEFRFEKVIISLPQIETTRLVVSQFEPVPSFFFSSSPFILGGLDL